MTELGRKVTVYGLASSEDGVVRYIGQTVRMLPHRLKGHFSEAKKHPNRRLSRWLAAVVRGGHDIRMVVLKSDAVWSETEREVIFEYRKNNADLVNGTDGGDGSLGRRFKHSEATKMIVSQKLAGIKRSSETKSRMSAAQKSRSHTWMHTPSVVEKRAAALRGKIPSNLAAIHEGLRGKPKSTEVRQKISESLRGRKQSADVVEKRKRSFRSFLAAHPEALEWRRVALAKYRDEKTAEAA